jgi:hypothetical protein
MTFSLDIEPEECVVSCTATEIIELVDALVKHGHLPHSANHMVNYDYNVPEMEYENALNDLHGKYRSLSSEDEQVIISISKKV